jgi:hypothetical protein
MLSNLANRRDRGDDVEGSERPFANDVEALPSPPHGEEDGAAPVGLSAALEEALRPTAPALERAGSEPRLPAPRRASLSLERRDSHSIVRVHGLAPQRQVSVHDLQPELDSAEAAQSEPDEGTMEQLCRRSSPTLELEVLDAHSPVRFADDGMSPPAPGEEQVELMSVMPSPSLVQPSPLAVPELHRAVSIEEELPPTHVEERSEHEERELALRIADRMLGSKAQRSAATTREDKEAPVRAWLLACSDAPSAWSCTTLGSSVNGLPSSASEPRIEVFGTNHLSVQHSAPALCVVRAHVLGWKPMRLCDV